MKRRRRIWTELLPPEGLVTGGTVALLTRHQLEPLIALPPSRETPEMAHALRVLSHAGVRVGLWPLLSDEEGYWPSDRNAEHFEARVLGALAFAAGAGAEVRTVAVDLEPPLRVTRALSETTWRTLATCAREALEPSAREERKRAGAVFARLRELLGARGVETLATAFPPVVLDFTSRAPMFQAILGTPIDRASWDVVSPMFYTSLIASLMPTGSLEGARAVLFEGARMLGRSAGSRAGISLGLISTGKLGNEPTLPRPEDLRADVAAARAAGIDDLALYSLEGILRAERPGAWLDAFLDAPPSAPSSGWRRAAASAAGTLATTLMRPAALLRR